MKVRCAVVAILEVVVETNEDEKESLSTPEAIGEITSAIESLTGIYEGTLHNARCVWVNYDEPEKPFDSAEMLLLVDRVNDVD